MVFDKHQGMDYTDEDLMLDYQNGDSQAFEVLFNRHSAKVLGYLLKRLKDKPLAEDLLQLTFLKLHRTRSLYDKAYQFKPWLFTICKGVLVDYLRKKGRNLEDSNSEFIEKVVDTNFESNQPEIRLDDLPPHQKTALELRYQQDLLFDEIALKLNTTPSNVRKLVSRGIQNLKILMLKDKKL